MKYIFFTDTERDIYTEYIHFDFETARTIDELRELKKLPIERQVEYLDIRKACILSFAVPKKLPRRYFRGFSEETYRDFRIYTNTEPMEYEKLKEALLEYSREVKGYVAYNGNRFDFLIFRNTPGFTFRNMKGNYYLIERYIDSDGKMKSHWLRLIDPLKIARAISPKKATLEHMAEVFRIRQKNTEYAENIYTYCQNDVKVLIDLTYEYSERGYCRTPQRTARVYLSEYLQKKRIRYIESEYPEEALPDYAGGICEIFHHYAPSGYVYDFNSLYPSVMSTFRYPELKNVLTYRKEDPEELKKTIRNICQEALKVAKESGYDPNVVKAYFDRLPRHYMLRIRVKDMDRHIYEHIPLPFSYTSRSRKIYETVPDCTYQVVGYEIFFLSFVKDYDIEIAYSYRPSENIFAEYFRTIYEQRKRMKAMNDEKELLMKIIMNASYGLFGLRDEKRRLAEDEAMRYMEYMKAISDTEYVNEHFRLKMIDEKKRIYELTGKSFSFHSIPAYAVFTTSHARFWLYVHILHILFRGYRVFYVDTDSIFTDYANLPTSDGMLGLKKEYDFQNAFFFARKSYTLTKNTEKELKMKGTGNEYEKKYVQLSMKNPEPKIVNRLFIDPTVPPLKIPSDDFRSRYNYAFEYYDTFRNLFRLYEEIYHENLPEILSLKIA